MKLLLVDDDPLVLKALKMILGQEDFVLKTALNRQECWQELELSDFDVLVLDIRLKEDNGVDLAQDILLKNPKQKILLLTTFKDEKDIARAFSYGVLGGILKDNVDSLIPAIKAVSRGNRVVDQGLSPQMLFKEEIYQDDHLTDKENQVIYWIAQGLNNREIGERLYLSEGTVRNHISNLLSKLNLRDRTQLAVYYYKHQAHNEGLSH